MKRNSGMGAFALKAMFCLSLALAAGRAEACQTCLDKGTIETRETCKACSGKGKTVVFSARPCTACAGTGNKTRASRHDGYGPSYSNGQGTFCRACRGTGEFKYKVLVPCGSCSGKGVLLGEIACPSCKGVTPGGGRPAAAAVQAAPQPSAVQTTQVEACTHCGSDGKTTVATPCEVCDHGNNHRKDKESGADVYKCRNCGKTCEGRFKPCACAKPDCPSCEGHGQNTKTSVCDWCGGDKIITPLEKAKRKLSANP
jgi:RecJ-like exonuclease